jgi:hypothetical protein
MSSNQTKHWSRAVVDIGIAYEENTDDVGQVLQAVAKEMREVEPWDKKLLEYDLMGVERFEDFAVVLRTLLKTRAGEQWGVAREFRRRTKLKFDELGIEIPWPQQVQSEKWYDETDAKGIEQERRKKRAVLLRYLRRMRGEAVEDEPAAAAMSVEERDRAETIAKRDTPAETEHQPVAEKVGLEMAAQRQDSPPKPELKQ